MSGYVCCGDVCVIMYRHLRIGPRLDITGGVARSWLNGGYTTI